MNIYIATSWNNRHFDYVVSMLKLHNQNVYNFKENSFSWKNFLNYDLWTPQEFINHLYSNSHCQLAFHNYLMLRNLC